MTRTEIGSIDVLVPVDEKGEDFLVARCTEAFVVRVEPTVVQKPRIEVCWSKGEKAVRFGMTKDSAVALAHYLLTAAEA